MVFHDRNPRPGQRLPSPVEMPITPRAAMLMAAVQQTLETSANLKLKAVV